MNSSLLRNLDYGLIAIVCILFLFGLLVIASATDSIMIEDGEMTIDLQRQVKVQIIAFGIGILAIIPLLMVDYQMLGDFYRVIYVLSILVMLTVYIPGLGVERFGARSWIDLGVIDFQPAEIAKLGFIITFAKYLSNREDAPISSIRDLIIPILFVIPFIGILLVQPDLGTALVFIVVWAGMLFVAGLGYKFVAAVAALLAAVGLDVQINKALGNMPFIYRLLKPHQRIRIDAFIDPNNPTLQGNYQVLQSKITIGSGMITGRGLFQGQYHRTDYLPVRETDFIFAVIGEELGFVGGIAVIFMFFLLLTRIIRIAQKAKDQYGSLIVMGVVFMFAFQIFENIGMTMGLMPVTGITLPFVSYGGSSIITNLLAIGLILSVHIRRKRGSYMYTD